MKRRVFFTGLMGLISGVLLNAQVTIGSMIEPGEGALLELKEHDPQGADISTATKGLLFPRVALTSYENLFPMFESTTGSGADTYYVKGSQQYLKSTQDATHIGLVVYNTDVSIFSEGLHFWDGTQWLRVVGNTPIKPEIDSLVCGSLFTTTNYMRNGQQFDAVMKITYTGGNGGTYTGAEPLSIGYGLTIERLAGTLAVGQGEVSYRISGMPAGLGSDFSMTFQSSLIPFLGKTYCSDIKLGGNSDVEIKPMQYMRKTIPWSSTTNSLDTEMHFGHLKLILVPQQSGNDLLAVPKINTDIETNAICWFSKMGSPASSSNNSVLYSFYYRTPLLGGSGSTYIALQGKEGNLAYGDIVINSTNQDVGEIRILLLNNKEVYRVMFNIVQNGSATIFIEKLD